MAALTNAAKLGYGPAIKLYGRGFNGNSEFIARIRAILRRQDAIQTGEVATTEENKIMERGNLRMDPLRHYVIHGEAEGRARNGGGLERPSKGILGGSKKRDPPWQVCRGLLWDPP